MLNGQMELNVFDYSKKNIRLEISHSEDIDKWIAKHHYLGCTPAGARIRMIFKDREGTIVGAMLWGRPTSRKIDQEKILELTRMYFVNDTDRFIESHSLGLARKHIRKHYPKIKGLLAYSSKGENHEGTIYEADNWFKIGVTKLKTASWETRAGRKDIDTSDKIKWVRSP